jgi:hypothetical protein
LSERSTRNDSERDAAGGRHLIEHLLHAQRGQRGVDVDLEAEAAEDRRQLLDALAAGRRVDPPHRRRVALAEEPTDRLVGRDHELLDELVGALDVGVALGAHDVAHQPRIVGVEDDLGLGQIEIERAAGAALGAQRLGQRVQALELAEPRPVGLAPAAEVAAQRGRDAGVVEARLRADHRRGVALADQLASRS